jgi:transposase
MMPTHEVGVVALYGFVLIYYFVKDMHPPSRIYVRHQSPIVLLRTDNLKQAYLLIFVEISMFLRYNLYIVSVICEVIKVLERSEDLRNQIQFTCLDNLVPKDHLLRKVEKALNFDHVYDMVEHLYCEDNGRPAIDPVVLVKMIFIQHFYGIRSLRQTVKEVDMNIAYRWFIGYGIDTPLPHFATISYAFATRFPSEVFENIFTWILDKAVERGFVNPAMIFIDGTQIKANANKNKKQKVQVRKVARVYDEQLRAEINADRQAHGKKPLKEKDNNDNDSNSGLKEVTTSTTDPECGMFHKGDHKIEFAYTAHVSCDSNNFVLAHETRAGNVHDSTVFDAVYEKTVRLFPTCDTVAVDAGYKTPWICKKVQDDGRNISTPYKSPMSKRGFFRPYEYVYDEYYNCVICPAEQILKYSTTNKNGYREFKSDPDICKECAMRSRCTESKNCQKIVTRHIWSPYIESAEDFRHSPAGRYSYSLRSRTIERVFADAKEKHGMRYTMLRGLERVDNWLTMKFAAMKLKKMATLAWQ